MKIDFIKKINRIIPLTLITLIIVGILVDFRAEMFDVSISVDIRADDVDRTAEASSTNNLTETANGAKNTPVVSSICNIRTATTLHGLYINPLTGLNTVNDISRNRPVAVSVSNQRSALPTNATNGISQADIVYEVPVEAGGTRMVALYQDFSGVGVVGSIRSARHYTVEIAEAYDAMFIHAGGSPLGFREIENRNISNFDEVTNRRAQIFRRDRNRIQGHTVQNYHSVTTSGSSFMQWLPTFGLRTTHDSTFRQALFFTDNPIQAGSRAHNVNVRFSTGKSSTFTYNEMQNIYYMSQFGSQFTDANNGSPVTFTNLLILKTPVTDLEGYGAGAGRQDMNTVGSGTGYFVSGGRYTRINWFRADKSSQFVYTFENGNVIELGRGKTYIGIIPTDMSASFN